MPTSPQNSTIARARRRSPKGEQRRQQILDAAMHVFARTGFSNASFAEVANQVGLTLPGLLHHFPSKTEMLLAVLEVRDQRSPRLPDYPHDYTLKEAAAGPPLPWSRVLEQLRLVNRANAELPGVIKAFSLLNAESLSEDHPAQDWFHRRSGLMLQYIAHSLRHAQQCGEVTPTADPDQIAAELIAMMDGLQLLWLRHPGKIDLDRYFEDYLQRLQQSLQVT
ncbi:MAG: TetR/AcrR family transcriptional regulator [Stenotrophomonas sp.]|uniref:TetR/AcrR family transcriptional regulator n=1 Tax=Stenotrophomonas sp. TaxID=69392 RepID=UPI0028B06A53|nr:TetR/AcrR family transcriptional regulator [Stenotrophomonas sp.]